MNKVKTVADDDQRELVGQLCFLKGEVKVCYDAMTWSRDMR